MGAFRSLRNSSGPTLSPSNSTQSPCSSERRSAKENPAREERDTESKSCSTSQASTARSASWRDRLAAAAEGEGCGEADRDEVEEVAPLGGREEPMDEDVAGTATAAAAEVVAADMGAVVGAEIVGCCTGTATAMRPEDGAAASCGAGADAKREGEGALLGRSVGEGFAEEDADAEAVAVALVSWKGLSCGTKGGVRAGGATAEAT